MPYILLFVFIVQYVSITFSNPNEYFSQKNTNLHQYNLHNHIIRLDQKLNNTIWTTTDIKENIDLYVFFKDNKKGVVIANSGEQVSFPKKMFPIKYVQSAPHLNSGIFLVTSENSMLYYAMRLFSEKYLGISAGYESIEPLLDISTSDYFEKGYILQYVPID